ncbi:polysaccharide lyase family 7 protein [Streptomyces sp. NPDC049954]|uniref:polysaccharide lyase family 7 protein n=1 Tax=Streptomyces sp. NPDC049954 TaxID=3155779 RepID=UPI00341F893F
MPEGGRCEVTSGRAQFVVASGQIKAYCDGTLQTTIAYTGSGNYFKAGAYTQANCSNSAPCADGNYGEVRVSGLSVSHS